MSDQTTTTVRGTQHISYTVAAELSLVTLSRSSSNHLSMAPRNIFQTFPLDGSVSTISLDIELWSAVLYDCRRLESLTV